MSPRPLAKDPFTFVVTTGASLIAIGAIMGWVKLSGPASLASKFPIYYFTLAFVVPLCTLCAHALKTPQLHAIAAVAGAACMNYLITYASTINAVIAAAGPYSVLDYEFLLAGTIMVTIGIVVSLVPAFAYIVNFNPSSRETKVSSVVHACLTLVWIIIGIIFAVAKPAQGMTFNLRFENTCFVFAVWTLSGCLLRIASLNLALAGIQIMTISGFVEGAAAADTFSRVACAYVAIFTIFIYVGWMAYEFVSKKVSDEMTHKTDGEYAPLIA